MKGRLLVVAAVVLLAGCEGPRYTMIKDGASDQTVVQDDARCQNQAQLIQASDWEYRGTFMEGANIIHKQRAAYRNCMISEGYREMRAN